MCDEHYAEDLANYMRFPPLTRRQFAAASMGAGLIWCPPDSAVYNEKQAERAWSRLLALFKGALA
jgi:hypothetical protein